MKHGVGIIGYGLSAKVFHIPFIQVTEELELTAICQRHVSPANDASKDHPNVRIFQDADALIQNSDVSLVILCTPPVTHCDLAKRCLRAGKHVVVEKPFCPTTAECAEVIACAKETGKLLSVFHNRRWDADYHTLLGLIRDKTLGRVVEFETHFDRWDPSPEGGWRAESLPGQGVVYDLASHLFDQVVHAFGMPSRVTGFIAHQRAQDASSLEDACTVLLHYDGMLATVKASALSAAKDQLRFWVRGDKGSYQKYHLDPQEPQIASGMSVEDPEFGNEESSKAGTLFLVEGEDIVSKRVPNIDPPKYSAYYRDLAKSLSTGSPLPVEAQDALDIIYLVELARESSRTGKTLNVETPRI